MIQQKQSLLSQDKGRIVISTKEEISSSLSKRVVVVVCCKTLELLSSPAMRSVAHQSRPLMGLHPIQISRLPPSNYRPQYLKLPHRITPYTNGYQALRAAQSQETHHLSNSREKRIEDDDGGIPLDQVKVLVKFKSRYNYIRVLEISRRADHQFAGSRLLLLDAPGNIHSVSFLLKFLTETYLDVFATFPPVCPPGPLGILGFGAGSAARLILELYPQAVIHGWELDPSVISVGREYFGVSELEKKNPNRLFIYEGDALEANVTDGFAGILVDLFYKGSLIPELQDSRTWEKLKGCLKKGGRIMVNLGGSCVESEDPQRDGKLVMEASLKAMNRVFPGQMFVLNLGTRKEDSSVALTGDLPDLNAWMQSLPMSLRGYASMWSPFHG